jgi:hypothetical protein
MRTRVRNRATEKRNRLMSSYFQYCKNSSRFVLQRRIAAKALAARILPIGLNGEIMRRELQNQNTVNGAAH